jgi:hypothetical protein
MRGSTIASSRDRLAGVLAMTVSGSAENPMRRASVIARQNSS